MSFLSYVHRVGRTARAGKVGCAVTFVTDTDRSLLKAIVSISVVIFSCHSLFFYLSSSILALLATVCFRVDDFCIHVGFSCNEKC